MNRVTRIDKRSVLACILLCIVLLAAFYPVGRNGFVWDDEYYILNNRDAQQGITADSVAWAFTTFYTGNWHPITWVSHILDLQVFGLHPSGHHLVNLAWHLLVALLLLLVLRRMTGSLWSAFFAAVLFAVHPLRVESVAWISERKDLLCGFFWVFGLGAYLGYVRRPTPWRYVLVFLAAVLALLSKPMAVTFPFALLLLDWWPLGRMRLACGSVGCISLTRLLVEKTPLLAISVATSIVTYRAQQSVGAFPSFSAGERLGNAFWSYVLYLNKSILPLNLAVFYPHPEHTLAAWKVGASVVALASVSVVVLLVARRRPCLLTGWFWFAGTLLPVSGFVQVGDQSMADRYTYIPHIGLFIAFVWWATALAPGRMRNLIAAGCGAVLVVACVVLANLQVRHWRSASLLFAHAVQVTKDNWLAENDLAIALANENRPEEALPHVLESIRINPNYPESRRILKIVQSLMVFGQRGQPARGR